ncbi:MAG: signal peptidase I [Myxococcota bacterium]
MATSTSPVQNVGTPARLRSFERVLVNWAVPALLATLSIWLLRMDTLPSGDGALGRAVAWLLDQVLLAWLLLFGVFAAVTRYWGKQLFGEISVSSAGERGSQRWLSILKSSVWILGAAALALALRAFVGEVCKVRSTSMLPTLYPGDLTWVSRQGVSKRFQGQAPKRGEVVLFEPPDSAVRAQEPLLFKRVVGLEGDILSVRGGAPLINDWGVPRCFVGRVTLPLRSVEAPVQPQLWVEWLGDATYLTVIDGLAPDSGPFTVKRGEVWVLGDNRNHSIDSRNWLGGRGGGVPVSSVRGAPSLLLTNSEAVPGRGLQRTETLALPPGSEGLASVFAKCLSLKPKVTTPPATAQ